MNYVSFLIDSGWKYQDVNQIKKGISRGKEILKNDSSKYNKKSLCRLCYYIGNGYSDLFSILCYKLGWKSTIANPYLTQAKYFYRKALKKSENANNVLKKRLWTNYGNCLDILGRGLEALYAYEEALKIDPNFPMALGNKAIAMRLFAEISGVYRTAIYIYAYNIFKSVVNEPNLIRVGGYGTKQNLEMQMQIIEGLIDPKILKKEIKHISIDFSKKNSFRNFILNFV